jgi:hypothetical protein
MFVCLLPLGIFYGDLGYFTYDHFPHFVFIWYIFSAIGIKYQEKSGKPGCVGSYKTSHYIQQKGESLSAAENENMPEI